MTSSWDLADEGLWKFWVLTPGMEQVLCLGYKLVNLVDTATLIEQSSYTKFLQPLDGLNLTQRLYNIDILKSSTA